MQQKLRKRNSGWFKEVGTVIKLVLFYRFHKKQTSKKKTICGNIKKVKGYNEEYINTKSVARFK